MSVSSPPSNHLVSLSLLQEEVRKLEKLGADEAEAFAQDESSIEIDVRNGVVENLQQKRDGGVGFRVIRNQGMGFAFTSDVSPEALEDARRAALASASATDPDPHAILPQAERQQRIINYFDNTFSEHPVTEKIERARVMENAARAASPKVKRTDIARYMESETHVAIASMKGVAGKYRKNLCGGFIDAIAEEQGKAESGFGMAFTLRYDDFHPDRVGTQAGEEAAAFLGARSVPTGKYRVLLHPIAAVAFLDFLAHALSGEAVLKKKSPFVEKLGQKIGSSTLTLLDDPALPDGLGSQSFDAEGIMTKKMVLIQDGTLQNFFHNTRSASESKTKSTGHASRSGYKSPPGIGPSNFFIPAGKHSRIEMIGQTSRGVLLQRVIGAHTINPISGDFSVGAAGYFIENGQIARPVSKITFSGNLFEYLQQLEDVGNDLQFYPSNGNIGSPTLAIEDGMISGT